MGSKYKFSFLFLLFHLSIFSQNPTSSPDLGNEIEIDDQQRPQIIHHLQSGETVYSLSKKYQTSVDKIMESNELINLSSLHIGQSIVIPIDLNLIHSGEVASIPPLQRRIPVHYKVKSKETLYRISKVLFKKSIESIMKLNNLNTFELSVGQKLLIGWILEPVKPESLALEIDQLDQKSTIEQDEPKDTINLFIKNKLFAKKDSITNLPYTSIKSRKEIAIWDKTAPNTNKMFALHKEAKKNSIIEIHNPLLNRTAFATVIGTVPQDSYTEDITLIISPEVAEALGALDRRFMVEVKYYQ